MQAPGAPDEDTSTYENFAGHWPNASEEERVVADPLILGAGKRMFPGDGAKHPLRLVHSQTTSTGAVLATYAPAGG